MISTVIRKCRLHGGVDEIDLPLSGRQYGNMMFGNVPFAGVRIFYPKETFVPVRTMMNGRKGRLPVSILK